METEPTRMCALLVACPITTAAAALLGAPARCRVVAHCHRVREVELVGLLVFGRPARRVAGPGPSRTRRSPRAGVG